VINAISIQNPDLRFQVAHTDLFDPDSNSGAYVIQSGKVIEENYCGDKIERYCEFHGVTSEMGPHVGIFGQKARDHRIRMNPIRRQYSRTATLTQNEARVSSSISSGK
jgi:hypothetical protein